MGADRSAGRRPLVGIISSHRLIEDRFSVQGVGTHNIESVAEVAGAQPLLIPGLPQTQDISALLSVFDGIMLTGGRANVHPRHYGTEPTPAYGAFDENRDAVSLELVRACVERGTPIFGICRGLQEMNVAFGGSLHPEVRDIPGRMNHRMPPEETNPDVIFELRHGVRLIPDGKIAPIVGSEVIRVNSLHGQAILRPGRRVLIEGVAEDSTPEAISIREAAGFAIGVQWHAEYKAGENVVNRRLFEAFGAAMRGAEQRAA